MSALIEAARAVVERWDTPLWKDVPATAVYINALRTAMAAAEAQPVGEPVAWGQLGTLNGRSYLRQAYDRTPYPPPAGVARELNLVPLYTAPPAQPAAPAPLTAVSGAVWGLFGEEGVSLVQRGTEDEFIAKRGGERLYRRATGECA